MLVFTANLYTRVPDKGVTCPLCGTGREEISRTGRAGCPDCYTVFEDMFMPYMKRIHGATAHVGKIPRRTEKGGQAGW